VSSTISPDGKLLVILAVVELSGRGTADLSVDSVEKEVMPREYLKV